MFSRVFKPAFHLWSRLKMDTPVDRQYVALSALRFPFSRYAPNVYVLYGVPLAAGGGENGFCGGLPISFTECVTPKCRLTGF